jgi:hypothetical protein
VPAEERLLVLANGTPRLEQPPSTTRGRWAVYSGCFTLRDPHTNDARQAELTRWRAPRQQRNQPFSLRLLDELVVVPVHTFVKVR